MCRRLPGAVLLIGGAEDGETCAIAALARSRFATTVAIGRRVIRAFSPIGAPALPWGDRARFAEAMLWPDPETRDAAPRLAPSSFLQTICICIDEARRPI